MYKLAFLSLFFSVLLFGKDIIEVFAKHISVKESSFVADSDVVILYDGSMIKSDRAFYDRNTSLLRLEGHVEMIGVDDRVLVSDRLLINTESKSVKLKKFFLSGEENLWIEATEAEKTGENYKLYNSKISSCDTVNPDWTIEFAEAEYHSEKNFVTMESAKLRFYDTTVFYFPYLALPTLSERTTGLLYPDFKLSDREGFLYEQPIYYVVSNNLDIEFNPQIRTKRGMGAYLTARFVDSNHSEGFARVGYFANESHYADVNNMNRNHLGAELFYKSTDILSDSSYLQDYESGFYLNGTYLNDREYLNLQKESASSLITSNLIESRLNTFVYDEDDYFGLYVRYNIDTSKTDNRDTIQNMPSLHYHHYMSQIMDGKLFYTIDARVNNYTRRKGSTGTEVKMDAPITYYESFFDDLFNVSLSENLYLSRINFRNLREDSGEYYYYYRNYHTFKLSSDLSKKQGGFLHNISPSITYIKPSIEHESPTKYRNLDEEKKEFLAVPTQEEQLSFALSQHFYSLGLDMNFFHRFAYSSYLDRVESRGDIHNEMGYEIDNLGLYSNLTYAWNEKQIRSLTSTLRYNQSNYDIMLTHFYNHDFLLDSKKASFINNEFVYHYSDKDSWFLNFDYDLEQKFNHEWNIGWTHRQKCWSARVSFGQEVVPNIDNSFRNSVLYLELNLNPIGGIQQNIEEDFSSQGN